MGTKTVPARPSELIILAINNLNDKEGSSPDDILQFISEEFQMKPEEVTPRVHEALKRAITYGIISQKNGKYKIQDIPKLPPPDSEEGRGDDVAGGSNQAPRVCTVRKKAPVKRQTAKKRKQTSRNSKAPKRMCKRCQSRKKYSGDQ